MQTPQEARAYVKMGEVVICESTEDNRYKLYFFLENNIIKCLQDFPEGKDFYKAKPDALDYMMDETEQMITYVLVGARMKYKE